jgi:hypothetical protein
MAVEKTQTQLEEELSAEIEENRRFLKAMGLPHWKLILGLNDNHFLSEPEITQKLIRYNPSLELVVLFVLKDILNYQYIVDVTKKDTYIYRFQQIFDYTDRQIKYRLKHWVDDDIYEDPKG